MSDKTAHNAIELIQIMRFFHYDGIIEEILKQAWRNGHSSKALPSEIAHMFYIQSQEGVEDWHPIIIRETAVLLASFSLIKIDETGRCTSMHPSVHVWARYRFSQELQGHSWISATSTLLIAVF